MSWYTPRHQPTQGIFILGRNIICLTKKCPTRSLEVLVEMVGKSCELGLMSDLEGEKDV